MTQQYQFSGITCNGCVRKVTHLLSEINGVEKVEIDLATQKVSIDMLKNIKKAVFEKVIEGTKYKIVEEGFTLAAIKDVSTSLAVYKPLFLIFAYIFLVSILASGSNLMLLMRYFMAGFFLVFSFFKLLNLKGFAESYQMYDIVAKYFPSWGKIYPFVELGLGIAYFIDYQPFAINIITVVVMSVSIIGVLQSVLNKRKIQCACLGAVFNLPMSSITIIEDALMIFMAITMLFLMS